MKKTFLIICRHPGPDVGRRIFRLRWFSMRNGPTGAVRTIRAWPARAAPVRWSTTENVKWKTPIPGKGHSTPIIWEDRIYLTTAVPHVSHPRSPRAPTDRGGLGRKEAKAGPAGNGRRGWSAARAGPTRNGGRRMRERFRRRMQMTLVEHKFEVLCLDKETGKDPVAADRNERDASRGLPPALWQLRLQFRGHRRPSPLRLLRLPGPLRLRPGRESGLEKELRREDENAQRFRRGNGAGPSRRYSDPQLRPRGPVLHSGSGQEHGEGTCGAGTGTSGAPGPLPWSRSTRVRPRSS